jgi:AGZA family xanthine/uracil permease-like MFS transporter
LLSTLAGIAITFISMSFALQIWQRPLVAMVPLAIVLLIYFSHVRFPLGLPGGLVAVALGTGLAWLLPTVGVETDVAMSAEQVREAWAGRGRFLPEWAGGVLWEMFRQKQGWAEILPYLSLIIPMGLFNVLGSLQNIESAEAGGDIFPTGPSLAVNGLGTIAAALFGSCFPTTIYIGHPGWKALGARAGYSTLNAVFVTAVCLTGTVPLISRLIPLEAGIGIVLWIGVVITAQAFQTSPVRHAPAAAFGLFPAIAAWGASLVMGTFTEANRDPVDASMRSVPAAVWSEHTPATSAAATRPAAFRPEGGGGPRLPATTAQALLESRHRELGRNTMVNGFFLHGLNILERGYIFTCMVIAAVSAHLIDRRFYHAAGWAVVAAVLTFLGLMHAYQLAGNQVDYLLVFSDPAPGAFAYRGYALGVGYLLMACVFVGIGYVRREPPVADKEARAVSAGPSD